MRKLYIFVMLILIFFMFAGSSAAYASFDTYLTDIDGHWAQNNIIYLVENNIAKGYPDNTFRPDDLITRAEFIKMFVKAVNDSQSQSPKKVRICDSYYPLKKFSDKDSIPGWAKVSVAAAVYNNVITGYPDGRFGPDLPITRGEIAVIIGNVFPENNTSEQPYFTDRAEIPDWVYKSLVRIGNKNIIRGYPDGTFRPDQPTTRAEAVRMLYVLNKGTPD